MGTAYAGVRTHVANRGLVTGRPLRGTSGTPDLTPDDPEPETPPLPNPPVVLSIVESSLTTDGCTLTITVDQNCRCFVVYDTDSGAVEGDYAFATNQEMSFTYSTHVQRLAGLTDDTQYFYRAIVENADTQETVSAQGDFTTVALVEPPPDPPDPPEELYPPLVAQAFHSPSAVTIPNFLQVKAFSDLGTEFTRVGTNIIGQGHRYAIPAAWNISESLVYLDYPNAAGSGNTRPMLDGQTLEVIFPTSGPFGHFRWSPVRPDKGYTYSNPNVFKRYTVTSAGFTLEQQWVLSVYSQINYTGGNGRPSNDARYHSFQWKKSNNDWGIGIIDQGVDGMTTSGTLTIQEKTMGNSTADINTLVDATTMTWDGAYLIAIYEIEGAGTTGSGLVRGIWAYENGNLSATGRKLSNLNRHSDVSELVDGTPVVVQASCASTGPLTGSGGHLGYIRVDNAAWTSRITSYANAHVGCANILRPGFAVVSNFSTSGSQVGRYEVWALELATGQVMRFGYTNKGSNTAYAAQPQATSSPTMTRTINRADYDNGDIYCFVAGIDVVRA